MQENPWETAGGAVSKWTFCDNEIVLFSVPSHAVPGSLRQCDSTRGHSSMQRCRPIGARHIRKMQRSGLREMGNWRMDAVLALALSKSPQSCSKPKRALSLPKQHRERFVRHEWTSSFAAGMLQRTMQTVLAHGRMVRCRSLHIFPLILRHIWFTSIVTFVMKTNTDSKLVFPFLFSSFCLFIAVFIPMMELLLIFFDDAVVSDAVVHSFVHDSVKPSVEGKGLNCVESNVSGVDQIDTLLTVARASHDRQK